MRFFRWRVWRAVPELDALSPAQAKMFVRASERKHTLVTVRWGVPVAVLLASFLGLPWAIIGLAIVFGASPHTFSNTVNRNPALAIGAPVTVVVLSIIAAWGVRRAIVLRAVRCGLASGVLPEVLPSRGTVLPLWRSIVGSWRWAATGMAVLLLVVGVPIGRFEWTLARDARLAEADRTGVGPLNALWRSVQPSGTTWDQENAWNAFDLAMQRVGKVDKNIWKHETDRPVTPSGAPLWPDFASVGCAYRGQSGNVNEADFAAAVMLARELVPLYREAGVFEAMTSMRSAPRRDMAILTSPGATMVDVPWARGVQSRELARINRARMVLAEEAGDRAEFVEAFRAGLALAGMNSEYPNIIGRLIGCACDALSFTEVRIVLAKHPSAEWLDDIEKSLRLDRVRPPLSYTYEAEKASEMDVLASAFSNKETIRTKRWNAVFGDERGTRQAVGSYAENKAFISAAFDAIVQHAGMERPVRPAPADVPKDRLFPSLLVTAVERSISMCDQLELERRGVVVMLALERYYLEHHAYPDSLDALTPDRLKTVPIDPWSGRPLGYRRLTTAEREADPQHREYFLWSVGGDGVDNGGRWFDKDEARYAVLATTHYPGYDFVVNDITR